MWKNALQDTDQLWVKTRQAVSHMLHWLYLRLRNVSLQLTGVILLTDLQLNSIAYFERAQSAVKGGAHMFYKDVHLYNAL